MTNPITDNFSAKPAIAAAAGCAGSSAIRIGGAQAVASALVPADR